jgi:pyrroloquinoline quinone biosynthesis protein B
VRPLAALAIAALALAPACRGLGPDAAAAESLGSAPEGLSPYVLVLGTAQDGGFPQIACEAPPCRAARANPERRRLVASLLVVDPRTGSRWLIDATPDLREQVERARGHGGPTSGMPGRPPLFDGIFLTHAHMGHYTGLIHLGRESYATERTPVHGSERLIAFLGENGPWELLARAGHVELSVLEPDVPFALADDLSITALPVPHRPEYSDTFAYLVRGPRRAVLYVPDIDKWELWDRSIDELVREVDTALLDGSFFADGEVPGRAMADIPHPFIVESLARLATLPAADRAKVRFTHLNHTNPATDPESEAAAWIRAAGMSVAREGEVIRL